MNPLAFRFGDEFPSWQRAQNVAERSLALPKQTSFDHSHGAVKCGFVLYTETEEMPILEVTSTGDDSPDNNAVNGSRR